MASNRTGRSIYIREKRKKLTGQEAERATNNRVRNAVEIGANGDGPSGAHLHSSATVRTDSLRSLSRHPPDTLNQDRDLHYVHFSSFFFFFMLNAEPLRSKSAASTQLTISVMGARGDHERND